MRPQLALAILILAYLLGLALFPPRGLVVTDEALYLDQAIDLAHGTIGHTVLDPVTGETSRRVVAAYPLGTAALLAPAYAAGGWRALPWIPALAWAAAVALTGALLADRHRPVLIAAFVGLFLPALFAGRLLMSDAPSVAIVALSLLAFFRAFEPPDATAVGSVASPGRDRRACWALLAGFAAGLATLFRETNALVLAPFCLGAVLRRERLAWPLFWGGLAGLAIRLGSSWLAFGSALGTRTQSSFGFDAFAGNLALYGVALLVLFPAGLLATFLYRGPRRPELIACVTLYVLLFCLYEWRGQDSGWLKSLVLGPRFFLPLTPVLALALADALARRWAAATPTSLWRRLAAPTAVALTLGGPIVAFVIHPVFARWAAAHDTVRQALYDATPNGAVLVTNSIATSKYLHRAFGDRTVVDLDRLTGAELEALARRPGGVWLVLFERFETPAWEARNAAARARLDAAFPAARPVLQRPVPGAGTLSVWTTSAPAPTAP